MTVKKKSATRKKATVKKKTMVKKKSAHVIDNEALAVLDADIDGLESGNDNEPLLLHDPLAMISGDEDASGEIIEGPEALLSNDPFAMLAEGGEETEQHFGFRTEASVPDTGGIEEPGPAPRPELQQPVLETGVTEMVETEQNEASSEMDKPLVYLGTDLTIADVESKKIELAHVISDGLAVKLNGEDLEQVDGAGLQLLAVFFKQAAKNNLDISWQQISDSLLQAVRLVGLEDLLKMQDVAVEDDGEGSAWGLF
jgi:ABC-type transporter Mla MlaB component